MRGLSRKISSIPESATIAIADTARRMQAEGVDVISLSIGEPDFDTPAHITRACMEALERGETHYAASPGLPQLRRAIAEKIRSENGFEAVEGETIVTCGAKSAIYEAMEAVLNPGDEVVILDPSWVSYEPCVRIAGGVPVHFPLDPKSFQVPDTLSEAITRRTRMIVINTPSNPAGSVLNASSLRLVADLCQDHDLIVLSDEIYEKLVFGTAHISLGSLGDMHDRTITVNGFSKAYAMTGWRIGYAVAPAPIIGAMVKVQQHTVSHPTTFAMWGALVALTGDQGCVEAMRLEFDRRRKAMTSVLDESGIGYAPANGAFYLFVKVEGDDIAVAKRWLEDGRVAATPGSAFNTPGWIRLSYAASMPRLMEALDRILPLM